MNSIDILTNRNRMKYPKSCPFDCKHYSIIYVIDEVDDPALPVKVVNRHSTDIVHTQM